MTYRYIDQEIAPRNAHGCDHGVEAKVLIRSPCASLLWRPGHKYWGGVGRPQAYAPASLEIANGDRFGMTKHLGDFAERGVRLHEALRRHRDTIDAAFGPGTSAAIDPRRTLVIEP